MQTGSITRRWLQLLSRRGRKQKDRLEFFWQMKPMIRNTLNHGTTSTIRASVLKMKLTKRLKANNYTFVDGRMQTGWNKLPVQAAAESGEAQTATPSEAAPVSGADRCRLSITTMRDGKRASGWREPSRA